MYLMRRRICASCGKELIEGDKVYQIEVDSSAVGFTYIHKTCMDKKKAEPLTYKIQY